MKKVNYFGIKEMKALCRYSGDEKTLFVENMFLDDAKIKHYEISYLNIDRELVVEKVHLLYDHDDKDLFCKVILDEED